MIDAGDEQEARLNESDLQMHDASTGNQDESSLQFHPLQNDQMKSPTVNKMRVNNPQ